MVIEEYLKEILQVNNELKEQIEKQNEKIEKLQEQLNDISKMTIATKKCSEDCYNHIDYIIENTLRR